MKIKTLSRPPIFGSKQVLTGNITIEATTPTKAAGHVLRIGMTGCMWNCTHKINIIHKACENVRELHTGE